MAGANPSKLFQTMKQTFSTVFAVVSTFIFLEYPNFENTLLEVTFEYLVFRSLFDYPRSHMDQQHGGHTLPHCLKPCFYRTRKVCTCASFTPKAIDSGVFGRQVAQSQKSFFLFLVVVLDKSIDIALAIMYAAGSIFVEAMSDRCSPSD